MLWVLSDIFAALWWGPMRMVVGVSIVVTLLYSYKCMHYPRYTATNPHRVVRDRAGGVAAGWRGSERPCSEMCGRGGGWWWRGNRDWGRGWRWLWSFVWGVSFGASATSYHVSPTKGRGSGTHYLCLHKDLSRNSSLLTLLYTHFIGHRSIRTVPMLFHPCTV